MVERWTGWPRRASSGRGGDRGLADAALAHRQDDARPARGDLVDERLERRRRLGERRDGPVPGDPAVGRRVDHAGGGLGEAEWGQRQLRAGEPEEAGRKPRERFALALVERKRDRVGGEGVKRPLITSGRLSDAERLEPLARVRSASASADGSARVTRTRWSARDCRARRGSFVERLLLLEAGEGAEARGAGRVRRRSRSRPRAAAAAAACGRWGRCRRRRGRSRRWPGIAEQARELVERRDLERAGPRELLLHVCRTAASGTGRGRGPRSARGRRAPRPPGRG